MTTIFHVGTSKASNGDVCEDQLNVDVDSDNLVW